jgi:TolB protein
VSDNSATVLNASSYGKVRKSRWAIRRSSVSAAVLLVVSVCALGGASPAGATVPGLNGRIVYVSNRGYLSTMNANGTDRVTLRATDGGLFRWSPDGSELAYQANDASSNEQVFVMNADGSGVHQVTTAGGANPTWSPDGTKIAFANGGTGIYSINTDGTGLTQLTSGDDWSPAWSPDGSKILFSRFAAGSYDLWTVNANGTNETQLTDNTAPMEDLFASWSPDGSKIAFERGDCCTDQIFVMNADGTGQTQLTSTSQNYEPVWSPTGTQVGFISHRSTGLWTMNPDGSAQTRATIGPSLSVFDWQSLQVNLKASKAGVRYGGNVALTAHLASYATTANPVLSIYATPYGGTRRLLTSGPVDASGNLTFVAKPGRDTTYTATWSGDGAHPAGGTSDPTSVLVTALTSGRLSGYYAISGRRHYHLYHYHSSCPSRFHTGCPVFTGLVVPNHAGHRVYFTLQVLVSGRWRTKLSFHATLGRRSSIATRLVYTGPGVEYHATRIRATFKSDTDHVGNTSRWAYLEVTR